MSSYKNLAILPPFQSRVALTVLGFQECNANYIAVVDDDNIQYTMKTLHMWLTPAYSAPRIP